jgi:hypothetical protein
VPIEEPVPIDDPVPIELLVLRAPPDVTVVEVVAVCAHAVLAPAKQKAASQPAMITLI